MDLENLSDGVIEQLITEDIEGIVKTFEETFVECVNNVKKPNVLVLGVTGAGKSTLVNSVFGNGVAEVGDGVPLTKHFTRFEPANKPVVIFDSKGLEDGRHAEFIEDTRRFFDKTQASKSLENHIHIIWYVVNAAWTRFEPFEVSLVSEVLNPIPVVFILNKADVASGKQLEEIQKSIESYHFENCKGIYKVVAKRSNYSQSWCPRCLSGDVTFKKTTNELFCDECNAVEVITPQFGLTALVDKTAQLLPDLAKEAFLFAQNASFKDKDARAKVLVNQYALGIRMDVSGKALSKVAEMVGRLFVLWGWSVLGDKVSGVLVKEMKEEYGRQDLSVRLAMIAADTILKRKLSRSVIACLGVMVNKPLRKLSSQLLTLIEKNQKVDPKDILFVSEGGSDQFTNKFMQTVFDIGISNAIDHFWED